ncbi:7548_t:CDS:1, partial [Paraglomus occultum]
MASLLLSELLAMIFDDFADDLNTLHSCILVNKNWCAAALPVLWARPFTLLRQLLDRILVDFLAGDGPLFRKEDRFGRFAGNLITTFIECFTDVDSL